MTKLFLLLTGCCLFLGGITATAEFVQSPYDFQAADTLDMVFTVVPDAQSGQFQLQADIYGFYDANDIHGAGIGFYWDNPNLQMDSAKMSTEAEAAFDFWRFLYKWNEIDTTNRDQQFLFAGGASVLPGMPASPNRTLWASYYFTLSGWSELDSIVFDTVMYGGATPYLYSYFHINGARDYKPYWSGPKVIYDTPAGCCVLRVGDANGLDGDEPTIGDLSVMIDAKFISGTCDGIIACLGEADINLSGGADPTCNDITIGDISILQDYLFISQDPALLVDCY